MTVRIDDRVLDALPRQAVEEVSPPAAYHHVAKFGAAARWLFRPEILQKAAAWLQQTGTSNKLIDRWSQPLTCEQLSTSPGSSWVVVGLRDPQQYPWLRSAFVVPLRWQQQANAESLLPQDFQTLAQRVRELLRCDEQVGSRVDSYRLAFDPSWSQLDCSGLSQDRLQANSGGASLTAGLRLALDDVPPNPRIWASGSWTSQGQLDDNVGLVKAKLATAQEFGVARFYLPCQAMRVAQEQSLFPSERLGVLAAEKTKLYDILQDYLAELDAPPYHGSFEQRQLWYLRRLQFGWSPHRPKLAHFYREHLLTDIVQQLQPQVPKTLWNCHLVTIASSGGIDLPELTARTFAAAGTLLFYTPDQEKAANHARQAIQAALDHRPSLVKLDPEPPWAIQMKAAWQQRWPQVAPEQLVFDLTPGSKEMSLNLAFDVAPAGSSLVYLQQTWQGNHRLPGGEQLKFWQVHS